MPVPTSTFIARRSSSFNVFKNPKEHRRYLIRSVSLRQSSVFHRTRCDAHTTSLSLLTILPVELLDLIIEFSLQPVHSFASVAGFSLASRPFRQIALRHYFSLFHVCTAERWRKATSVIPQVTSWARILEASADALLCSLQTLRDFRSLRIVHLSFFGQNIVSQHKCVNLLISSLPSNLHELSLTDVAAIIVLMLSRIGTKFPLLTSLEISCPEWLAESCCWSCIDPTVACPIPDVFPTTSALVNALIRLLKPLTHLQHLQLGFFLPPDDVEPDELLSEHFDHALEEGEDLDGPFFCGVCEDLYSPSVALAELQASVGLAQAFKQLKSVRFSSFFQKSGACERKTTIWISRVDGWIKVRRGPWYLHNLPLVP
ncbi:hypothetical protein BD410DRAFT_134686 [Rickenella mellea]|uniref:F-box domain-containing protein n=1 Tax=Rickenella mellea TaxID=50990 RepID=A0A4Y7QA44_9AGAM|nr:hypothetical protein BD410DRAFT_134686 [Rickenella mellea]